MEFIKYLLFASSFKIFYLKSFLDLGKVHEWNDMDPSELPNAALLAGHAAPSLPSPEIINPMIEDLNSNTGRGETFVHRPNSFVSAYRRVFDSNRGVFGSKTSGNNIDNSGNKGSSEANNDNTKTNTTTSHTVKDNWVVKDTSKPGKSLLPTWGTLKRYQNNGNNKTKPIHAPKTVETPKPVNAFARDNTKSQGLKQDNKLLYTSPLERKSINKPANEVVKITTANAFVSPAPLKKVWTPNVSATPSGRSVTAATASSAASTSSASTTRLVFTPSSLRHTGTATPSTPATSNKFTSFKPTFSTCTPLAPICSLTSTITPRHEVLTPVESTVINNSKATNSVPSSATSNRSTTIPSTPSSILKKGSATSTEIQQSVDHNINSQMDDFIEKNFTPLPKVDVLDTSKKNAESVDPAKIDRACIHRKMDDFIASNYKPESYEKKPTASIIKKPSAQMPEQGDISYTAVVTPRLKRKVSIKATEKASEISKDKSNVDPAEKNQVTITPITPARHKRVMISTSNEYPKRFQSTPDISATQNMTDKQIALSHFGSPASRRRMPLSTTNQNIVSFFENKHKTTVDAVPFGGGHMQRRSISANTRNSSRQSEIPKGASYIDFQADTGTGSTNTSKEWGINYVPTTSMVAKTKALFEGKENQGHLPIQKSRTFSSFPTDYTYGDGVAITPSPPKRSSSKKVTADYQVLYLLIPGIIKDF